LRAQWWDVAVAVWSFAFALPIVAQSTFLDFPVRVTAREDAGERKIVGQLRTVGRESLTIRVEKGDSILTIDRRAILRVERGRRAWPFRTAITIGCLTFGSTLALLGSQVRDPDSPGIERAVAIVGFGLGCALGAASGALAAWVKPRVWEEISFWVEDR
jgi:hypothetical protein